MGLSGDRIWPSALVSSIFSGSEDESSSRNTGTVYETEVRAPNKTNILHGLEENTRELTKVTVTLYNFLTLKRKQSLPNVKYKHGS